MTAKPSVAPRPSRRGGATLSDAVLGSVSSFSSSDTHSVVLTPFPMSIAEIRGCLAWELRVKEAAGTVRPARPLNTSASTTGTLKRPRSLSFESDPLEIEDDDDPVPPPVSQLSQSRRVSKAPRVASPPPVPIKKRDTKTLVQEYGMKASAAFLSNVAPAFNLLEAPKYVCSLFFLVSCVSLTLSLKQLGSHWQDSVYQLPQDLQPELHSRP